MASEDDALITFPDKGGFQTSGVGENTFDFSTGRASLYDGTRPSLNLNLQSLRMTSLHSLYLWSDEEINVILKLRARESRRINYDLCGGAQLFSVPFDHLTLDFPRPGNYELIASTRSNPTYTLRVTTHMMRFSSGSSSDLLTAVNWRAMDVLGRKSSDRSNAMSSILHPPNLHTKTFQFFNKGSNPIDVRVEGKGDSESALWLNDPSTNEATTIPGSGKQLFTSLDAHHLMRLLVKNTIGGRSSSYEVHFIGQVN